MKILVASLLAGVFVSSAFSAVSYTNYDALLSSNQFSGPVVTGSSTIGFQFTAGLGGQLGVINASVSKFTGSSSAVMTFFADNSNTLGAQLGQVTAPIVTTAFNPVTPVAFDFSSQAISISGASKYWVEFSTPGSNGLDLWNYNVTGATSLYEQNGVVGSGGTQGAFDVNVNAVPEPVSMLAIGAGLLGLARRRRQS